jgi:hypothetical protein
VSEAEALIASHAEAALRQLHEGGPQCFVDLACRSGLRAGEAAQALAWLDAQGMVRRNRCPGSRGLWCAKPGLGAGAR